jgi:hypothetical protein
MEERGWAFEKVALKGFEPNDWTNVL